MTDIKESADDCEVRRLREMESAAREQVVAVHTFDNVLGGHIVLPAVPRHLRQGEQVSNDNENAMTLAQFEREATDTLHKFCAAYRKMHEKIPEDFPLKMWVGDWYEQLQFFDPANGFER